VPRQFTAISWLQHPTLRAVFADFDVEVPPDFWSEDVEAERSVAIVACPCGQEPHVPLHRTEFCSGCNRVFWYLGDRIKVARNPDAEPSEEPEDQSSDARRKLDGDGGPKT
jgi:hypothetical protein